MEFEPWPKQYGIKKKEVLLRTSNGMHWNMIGTSWEPGENTLGTYQKKQNIPRPSPPPQTPWFWFDLRENLRWVFVTTMCFYGLTNHHHLMFNVEFVHWVRKASIGELGRRGDERRWEAHHISEENWGIGLEVSLLPLIHYTQHRGTTPTRKSSFLSFFRSFSGKQKVTLINPWCPNVWDTWRHMRKCGVLGSYIIFMCIRVYLVQRKKHKSPYRPYFMLTSSLVPLYPNLSRLPRALFNGSPPHMFCALFLFWFPHV
jgi:hypothetical protein